MKRSAQRSTGFSLAELMIVMAIAGVLAGIGFVNFSQRWSQERLLAASRRLNSWLDEQRRFAMHQTGTCQIAIDTATATLIASPSAIELSTGSSQSTIPNICSGRASLAIKTSVPNGTDIQLTTNPTSSTAIRFSFRGLSETIGGDGSPLNSVELRLKLPKLSRERCVKVVNPLGMIRNGMAADSRSSCNYSNSF
jgi:prepilin-type N-terminal cleavage/methylation domain-containing protein